MGFQGLGVGVFSLVLRLVAYVAALSRQTGLDQAVLRFGDFHPRSISQA